MKRNQLLSRNNRVHLTIIVLMMLTIILLDYNVYDVQFGIDFCMLYAVISFYSAYNSVLAYYFAENSYFIMGCHLILFVNRACIVLHHHAILPWSGTPGPPGTMPSWKKNVFLSALFTINYSCLFHLLSAVILYVKGMICKVLQLYSRYCAEGQLLWSLFMALQFL